MRALAVFSVLILASACASPDADDAEASTQDVVGGTRAVGLEAGGHLLDLGAPSKVACGATLIAPRVVATAAHCVVGHEGARWAFATGDVGSSRPIAVKAVHAHPEFHASSEGMLDLKHKLRLFDVAYLVLEAPVAGVTPAPIAARAPRMGDAIRVVGYHAEGRGPALRMSTPASVVFTVRLAGDPIFEVHPENDSALCVADGDEGSPVFDGSGAFVGLFVGSVTQGFTDCVRGSQYLDGYESAFGFRDFLLEGVAAGR